MAGKPKDAALMAAIGARIRALRLARGLQAQELARQLGVTPQQLAKYQWGHNRLSPEHAVRLAEIFGVSVDYLFRGETADAA